MVLGSSLAHSLTTRSMNDSNEKIKKQMHEVLSDKTSVRFSLAALYRRIIDAYIKSLGEENLIYDRQTGKQNGKDKKATRELTFLVYEKELVYVKTLYITAKKPAKLDDITICAFTKHAIARGLQTFKMDDPVKLMQQFIYDDLFLRFLAYKQNYEPSYVYADKVKAMLLDNCIAVFRPYSVTTLRDEPSVTFVVKTFISYDSMTPKTAEYLKNKATKHLVVDWKDNEDSPQ